LDIVLVFATTHNALAAEDFLRRSHFPLELLPTPREISASCGISIRLSSEHLPAVHNFVKQGLLRVQAVYKREGSNYVLE
jgi:hypothetical protein